MVEQEAELQALEGRLAQPPIHVHNLAVVLDRVARRTSSRCSSRRTADLARVAADPLQHVLAAALGMLAVIGVAFVAEQLDDRIKDADAVQDLAGLSTLGIIARMTNSRGRKEFSQLAGLLYPRSSFAEAYRTVRTNIEFASLDAPVRTLLVPSSPPVRERRHAANLAIVFAQSGRR